MDQTLLLHNALGREKQVFSPIDPNNVGVYVCGPTVYSYAHIGNARPAVVFDTMVRCLRALFPKVTYVSNITDIDDKIIDAAIETGTPISDITKKYTDIYNADMATLGVIKPDVQPLATEHLQEMIDMISTLIEKGFAYETDGHVLFHVPAFKDYGRLSGRNRDEQIAGARIEVSSYKKDPADFVLWKPSVGDQPGWDSPWGVGRPGWHIECSAMSSKYLGDIFDIHGGGLDLIFPHHENEQAQSCCANSSSDFAKYWVHNGFVIVEGEKMSKSLGNVLLVHDLIKEAPGEVLRLNLLSTHYRQPLDWTQEGLGNARKTLVKFYKALCEVDGYKDIKTDAKDAESGVMEALCDDLNTPKAMAQMHRLFKTFAQIETDEEKHALAVKIKASGLLLGILQDDPQSWLDGLTAYQKTADGGEALSDSAIDALIDERRKARADKDFARADAIRDELLSHHIEILDSAEGTSWNRV